MVGQPLSLSYPELFSYSSVHLSLSRAKSVNLLLTPIWAAPITMGVPPGGALCGGADGPRLWAGRSMTWAPERHLPRVAPDVPCIGPDGPRWRGVVFLLLAGT
jgi:hypothetical protein